MKRTISFIMMACFGLMMAAPAMAITTTSTFDVSAEMPTATGTAITVSKVTKSGTYPNYVYDFDAWTHGTNLGFSTDAPLAYNSEFNIWLPAYYFALDVAPTGGAGNPGVQIAYTNGNNPNGANGRGLDYKGSATFVKVTGATGNQTETTLAGGTKRLGVVTGTAFEPSDIAGGFLRIYLGIADGTETGADKPEPFTNADVSGKYSGTFVVTSTM